jgi:hypothetical protein
MTALSVERAAPGGLFLKAALTLTILNAVGADP